MNTAASSTAASPCRQDEDDCSGGVPFRTGRFFRLANYWFFATREGPAMGPYDALEQAQQAVLGYVEFVNSASPQVLNLFTRSARPSL